MCCLCFCLFCLPSSHLNLVSSALFWLKQSQCPLWVKQYLLQLNLPTGHNDIAWLSSDMKPSHSDMRPLVVSQKKDYRMQRTFLSFVHVRFVYNGHLLLFDVFQSILIFYKKKLLKEVIQKTMDRFYFWISNKTNSTPKLSSALFSTFT